MTSGVKWNEDYADPKSDVAKFNNHKPEDGVDALVSYMRQLPREVPAGTRWLYSTGETNLVGILVSQATKKPLAQYLSEKIWVPAGHGAAGHLDPEQDRPRDQRLLHPGRSARLSRASGSSSLDGARVNGQSHRARRLAGRGHHRAHRPSASPGAAMATSGGPTPTAALPRAASSARASSSTQSASW
jgi:CubicO group peptidase (beta-lactamase class C family)